MTNESCKPHSKLLSLILILKLKVKVHYQILRLLLFRVLFFFLKIGNHTCTWKNKKQNINNKENFDNLLIIRKHHILFIDVCLGAWLYSSMRICTWRCVGGGFVRGRLRMWVSTCMWCARFSTFVSRAFFLPNPPSPTPLVSVLVRWFAFDTYNIRRASTKGFRTLNTWLENGKQR